MLFPVYVTRSLEVPWLESGDETSPIKLRTCIWSRTRRQKKMTREFRCNLSLFFSLLYELCIFSFVAFLQLRASNGLLNFKILLSVVSIVECCQTENLVRPTPFSLPNTPPQLFFGGRLKLFYWQFGIHSLAYFQVQERFQ